MMSSETEFASSARHVVFAGERHPPAVRFEETPHPSCTGAAPPELVIDTPYSDLFHQLCTRRGIDASRYRPSVVMRRRRACLHSLGVKSPEHGFERLQNPERTERALDSVLIGVTEFFRDGAPFVALAQHLDRPLITGPHLRVLSLGCSDGSELYSAAIILAERGLLPRTELCGIDCRMSAIAAARTAQYSSESIQGISADRRSRWFEACEHGFRITAPLRDHTRWEVNDVFSIAARPMADLIFCRNVAIYLQPHAAAELWRLISDRLPPGGLLMVGKAERPSPHLGFARLGPCLYQKPLQVMS